MTDVDLGLDATGVDVDPRALTWFDHALDIRADARARRRTATRGDQLYRLYLLVLLAAPFAYLLGGALQDTPRADPAAIAALLDRTAVAAPIALLVVVVAGLRLAAWTGPVVVSRADLAWLLSLPIPRAAVIRPRLRRALLVAGGVAGIAGGLATIPHQVAVGLPTQGPAAAEALRMAAAGVAGGAGLGVALAALGWLVEARRGWAVVVMRGSGVLQVLLVGLLAAAVLVPDLPSWLPAAALASGPWGWVTAGVLAAADGGPVGVAAGAVGLAATAAVAALLARTALATAGDVPLPELSRRAATSAQVTAAAVYVADFRSAAQARDRVVRALVGRSRRRLPMPRRAGLVPAWIGSTVLLRQPRRLGQAWLWLVAAVVVADNGVAAIRAAAGGEPSLALLLVPAAAALAHPAAGTLVEPLRVEVEQRFGLRMLRLSIGDLGLRHLAVPAVALWVLAVLAGLSAAAVGAVAPAAAAVVPVAALPAGVLLVLVAAVVASGPPADSTWLYTGEAGLGRLALHLLRGPLLAAVVLGTPVLFSADAIGSGDVAALGGAALSALAWTAALVVGCGRWVRHRLATHH